MPGRLGLLWGKVRRFWLGHFRPGYVRRQRELRVGSCARCGRCCSLGVRCPWLRGRNQCLIYEKRPLNCRIFPVDERDLRDVPECAFRFEPAASRQRHKAPETTEASEA